MSTPLTFFAQAVPAANDPTPVTTEQVAEVLPEPLVPFAAQILALVQGIVLCILLLVLGWVVSKWAEKLLVRILNNRDVDKAVTRFLGGVARYMVLAAALIAALGAVGVETTSLVALLGTVGLAIGLALQGNLSHFASGVMILFFRPFTIEDVVTVGGQTGVVTDIGLFATTLRMPGNHTAIVPNSAVTGNTIVRLTDNGNRRSTIEIGVAYGSDVTKVREVLLGAANRAELVLKDPAPAIAFVNFGASSLDFAVHCWCLSGRTPDMQNNVREAIYNDLNAAGIEIPFNQIVVHQAPEEEAPAKAA